MLVLILPEITSSHDLKVSQYIVSILVLGSGTHAMNLCKNCSHPVSIKGFHILCLEHYG